MPKARNKQPDTKSRNAWDEEFGKLRPFSHNIERGSALSRTCKMEYTNYPEWCNIGRAQYVSTPCEILGNSEPIMDDPSAADIGTLAILADEAMERLLSEGAESARALRLRLEGAIRTGVLPAGSRILTERRISELVGLSRSTVRSALDSLERDGLIIRHVGRGTFVASLIREGNSGDTGSSRPSPSQLLEFRLLIEPQLAEHLVLSASDEALEAIAKLVVESRRARDWRETEAADAAFHSHLCYATANPLFIAMADQMNSARQQAAWMHLKERRFDWERWQRYQSEHEAIIAALQARDADLAQQLLRDHLVVITRRFAV